jgi:hypothetical protein
MGFMVFKLPLLEGRGSFSANISIPSVNYYSNDVEIPHLSFDDSAVGLFVA